jgi:hypothetical protein
LTPPLVVFVARAWVPPGPGAAGSLNGKAVASEVGLGLVPALDGLVPALDVDGVELDVVDVAPEPWVGVTGPEVVGGAGAEVL